jgi:outer membrane receptor protein involved in Fe transport
VNAASVNAGELATEGLDVSLTQRLPLDFVGLPVLSTRGSPTRTSSRVIRSRSRARPGTSSTAKSGLPRIASPANLGFVADRFSLNFTGTYIGRSHEDDQTLASYDLEPDAIKIPAEFYLDMQTSFRASDQYELYFGVDNLLDNKPPNILSGSPFNTTGTDTNAGTYDVFGRRFYAGARFRF